MMLLLEIISLCLAACLCFVCTKSDLQEGLIYNRILLYFSLAAAIIDVIYYGIFARDIFLDFILNFLVVAFISLYLFFSHSFAGGDCKMTLALSLLFPARFYIVYGTSNTTLVFAIGFAIFAGYIYLLVSSVHAIITKKVEVSAEYIKSYLLSFIKSYVVAMTYIALLNCLLLHFESRGIGISIWLSRCFCLMAAWCVGKYSIFKKWYLFVPALGGVVVFSLFTQMAPISLTPENYTLVLVLLFCQMTIKTTIYEKVGVDQLKKGMILTTFSSVLMQSSITKGLPGVSTEDLRSRLTLDEIESIKIWAKATHTEELTIVKKIPFAVFISIGFLSYLILWGISLWV